MTVLRIDIETYSSVDLKKAGMHRYVESPDFEVLLFGYAFDEEPVRVVDLAQGEPLPARIEQALWDSSVRKTAYNAAFETTCLSRHLRRPMDITQWECTSVHALYLGLPGNLADVGRVVGLAADQQKKSSGWALIRYFCLPCKPTKSNGGRTRNRPHHDPAKWDLFKEYCAGDVVAEREIARKIDKFPVPAQEWKLWHLDQRMMNPGVLVDRELVQSAIECDTIVRERLTQEAMQLTGLSNPNSRAQLLAWLQEEEDEEISDLTKKTVPKLLENTDSDVVRRVLELRQELAKTSVSKYRAMERVACSDDAVRGLTQFYGANRTGRWAGRLVQVQNLPQNKLKDLNLARELIKNGDLSTVELLFGSVADTLSQLIRTAFVARPGKRFVPVDFSAIEARVVAWLAWCEWRLEVFKTHGKIYEASAEQMFKLPPGSVTKKSPYRQKGKVAELACLGENTMVITAAGLKPITAITQSDYLWDGVEWVKSRGVIFQGMKEVINLAGIQVTPDHLIKTGATWRPAQQLASNESTLCQAVATGSENLPFLPLTVFAAEPATWISCAFSALAARLRTLSIRPIFGKAAARDVMRAQKRSRAIGAKIGMGMQRCAQMMRTAGDCLIAFPRQSPAATVQMPANGWTTGVGEYASTNPGEKTKALFSRICSCSTAGMILAMTWIGLTLTKVTSRATFVLYREDKTALLTNAPSGKCSCTSLSSRPVFDILNSGPRNAFAVMSAAGPLLVHNCGYQGGVGALKTMGALEMGVPEDELPGIIRDWRAANPEVVDLWYALEGAAKDAVRRKSDVHMYIAGRRATLSFVCESGFLFIKLPSGRRLAYVKPRIEGEDLYREKADGSRYVVASAGSLTYEGMDQKTKQWTRLPTYGGKLLENITQAIARDCLAEAMLAIDKAGFTQLFTVHDEIIVESDQPDALKAVEEIMGRPIPWAPGLPLRGDGFETPYYMKEID